jgi:hypothetical protein
MIFVLGVMALFIVISIYFFFRAEKLQRDLIIIKRETSNTRKENKALAEAMFLIANNYEAFSQNRLRVLKEHDNDEEAKYALETMTPLIEQYGTIFSECLKGRGQLKKATQRCYSSIDAEAYKKFTLFVNNGDAKIKRLWAADNLKGFMSLVEALLIEHEHKHGGHDKKVSAPEKVKSA